MTAIIFHLEVSNVSFLPENTQIKYEHNLLKNFIQDYKQGKIYPPFSNEMQLSDLPNKERTPKIVSFNPKVQIKRINKICHPKTHFDIYLTCLIYDISMREESLLQ